MKKYLKLKDLIEDLDEQGIEVEGLICNQYKNGESGHFTIPFEIKEAKSFIQHINNAAYQPWIEDYFIEDLNDEEK